MTEWIFEDGDKLPHKGRCPQVNDLRHKIFNFWKKTTAIEVGPTGVRYEKAEE
jgi:hypothetical protein